MSKKNVHNTYVLNGQRRLEDHDGTYYHFEGVCGIHPRFPLHFAYHHRDRPHHAGRHQKVLQGHELAVGLHPVHHPDVAERRDVRGVHEAGHHQDEHHLGGEYERHINPHRACRDVRHGPEHPGQHRPDGAPTQTARENDEAGRHHPGRCWEKCTQACGTCGSQGDLLKAIFTKTPTGLSSGCFLFIKKIDYHQTFLNHERYHITLTAECNNGDNINKTIIYFKSKW